MNSNSPNKKPIVVIGLLGSRLDLRKVRSRSGWDNWRPSISICRQPDLKVHRFELIYQGQFKKLANQVCEDLREVSPHTEVRSHRLDFNDPWDFQDVYEGLMDFAENYPFRPDEEEYLVHITTGTHVAKICEFLLTEARYFPAKLLQTSPPEKKPADHPGDYQIIDLDLSRYDRLAMRFESRTADSIDFLKSGIKTRNQDFNVMMARVEKVALSSDHPILLTGPTGAGKSRLARRIYELKKQRRKLDGPFVEVNCATLRGDAAMSTLFGHVRGAFTGALKDRTGLLRLADQGMLFLDEVAELGPDEQAMLLRAIEEGLFSPLGSDREVASEFKLICGTNRNLHQAMREGRFRQDLYSRINLWSFELPGLCSRPEDIEPNLIYELDRYAADRGKRVTMNKEAREEFLRFATSARARWCSGFRDLIGAVTRMATLAPSGRITTRVVRDEIGRLEEYWQCEQDTCGGDHLAQLLGPEQTMDMDLFDKAQLAQVLTTCRECSTLSQAGRRLFSASRLKRKSANDADRLRKYLAKYGLSWDDVKGKNS